MPYPAPPGPRIAYDLDGTVGMFRSKDGNIYDVHPNAMIGANSERSVGASVGNHWDFSNTSNTGLWVAFMFPVAIRLLGVYARFDRNDMGMYGYADTAGVAVETSVDSTNGEDGTWVALPSIPKKYQIPTGDYSTVPHAQVTRMVGGGTVDLRSAVVVNDYYRRSEAEGGPMAVNGTGTRQVRAIRFSQATTFGLSYEQLEVYLHAHLYGFPDTAADPDRLAFWQTSTDEQTGATWFDWGDVPQESSADKTFRIKNLSPDKTAHSIVIDALPGGATTSPAPDGFLLFSTDAGVTWAATQEIATLSPLAVTGEIKVRRTVPFVAQLSNWAPRLVAEAGSWS